MSEVLLAILSGVRTVDDMVVAFSDGGRCRRLLEAMVWPAGRICPACGYRHSIALAGRDRGRFRARPGLYQCCNGDCRYQFTVTTRTPLHSTKLPLSVWFRALWLMLQSDKGVSSVRLAEAIGVSQPTAWRMGHALRLLVAGQKQLGGTIEIDGFYLGGRLKQKLDGPRPGRGRKGQPNTLKTPVLSVVQRPDTTDIGAPAGGAMAAVVATFSEFETEKVLENAIEPTAHLMSDAAKAFVAVGQKFAAHDTINHRAKDYVRGSVHANSAEGFNSQVRRTVAGVFHHISPQHADLYFHEIGFRWSQRVVVRHVERESRSGRKSVRPHWARILPALQLQRVFSTATGRQMRRTRAGGIDIKSQIAVFG